MIFPESLQSTRWSVCSAESSLVSVVALPSLVMIQQNTPSNSLISVIQKISHSFIGGISNSITLVKKYHDSNIDDKSMWLQFLRFMGKTTCLIGNHGEILNI